jgi:hypothetical protein
LRMPKILDFLENKRNSQQMSRILSKHSPYGTVPLETTHISCTRLGKMGAETLYIAGNEQRRYTSITRGKIPVNAAESSDARYVPSLAAKHRRA